MNAHVESAPETSEDKRLRVQRRLSGNQHTRRNHTHSMLTTKGPARVDTIDRSSAEGIAFRKTEMRGGEEGGCGQENAGKENKEADRE